MHHQYSRNIIIFDSGLRPKLIDSLDSNWAELITDYRTPTNRGDINNICFDTQNHKSPSFRPDKIDIRMIKSGKRRMSEREKKKIIIMLIRNRSDGEKIDTWINAFFIFNFAYHVNVENKQSDNTHTRAEGVTSATNYNFAWIHRCPFFVSFHFNIFLQWKMNATIALKLLHTACVCVCQCKYYARQKWRGGNYVTYQSNCIEW